MHLKFFLDRFVGFGGLRWVSGGGEPPPGVAASPSSDRKANPWDGPDMGHRAATSPRKTVARSPIPTPAPHGPVLPEQHNRHILWRTRVMPWRYHGNRRYRRD